LNLPKATPMLPVMVPGWATILSAEAASQVPCGLAAAYSKIIACKL